MNDRLGPAEVTTNGTGKVTDGEQPTPTHEGSPSLSAQSVDQRLEALMETIRTWDWRAAPVEAGATRTDEGALTVSGLATTATAEVHQVLEPPTYGPTPVQTAPNTGPRVIVPTPYPDADPPVRMDPMADNTRTVVPEPTPHVDAVPPVPVDPMADNTRTVVLEPMPRPDAVPPVPVDPMADNTQTVVLEPTPRPATVDPVVPMEREGVADGTSAPSQPAPTRRADTERGPIRRLWSHRWTKVALLCLAAAVAVVLIIWGLRLAHKSPSAGAPLSTTVPPHAVVHPHHPAFVSPIPAAQMVKYEQYAQGLQTANVTAAHALAAAGSAPTAIQLAPAITAYHYGVNLYDFQIRFIQWPAGMQPAVTVDHAQLEALVTYLQSFSSVSPTGVGPWLSQLHARTAAAEATDNKIRQDLGLAASTSFP